MAMTDRLPPADPAPVDPAPYADIWWDGETVRIRWFESDHSRQWNRHCPWVNDQFNNPAYWIASRCRGSGWRWHCRVTPQLRLAVAALGVRLP